MTWAEKGPNTAIVPGFYRFAPPVGLPGEAAHRLLPRSGSACAAYGIGCGRRTLS